MAKKKENVEMMEEGMEVKVRKTKIDYIPEDMIDEFNQLQNALASRKGGAKRDLSKLSPEELEAKLEKTRKRLAALQAAMGQ